ncbi:unnamed protein product, partial [Oppiella nova]
FWSLFLVYGYRSVITIVIISMVGRRPNIYNKTLLSDACADTPNHTHSSDSLASVAEFADWDDTIQALILSSFYYGYVITQLPGGVLAERYGGKWIMGTSMLLAAILSLLSPWAARLDYRVFIVTRVGLGLCDGVVYPVMCVMIAKWMPEWERSRGTTIIFTGSSIGMVVSIPVAGLLCDESGSISSDTVPLIPSLYQHIPARFVFVFFSFWSLFLVYGYRSVITIVIISMVGRRPNIYNKTLLSDACADTPNHTHSSDSLASVAEFADWDDTIQALILSSFYYGYVITQLPGGVLAERYGGKWIMGTSMLLAAILSLLSPWAARLDYRVFIVTRVGLGLCDGVVYPVMCVMIAKWMPEWERSRGTTIIFTGSSIGMVVSIPVAGLLCDGTFMGGWPAVFIVFGLAGCVWVVLWAVFVYESPDTHPYISIEEYEFIVVNQTPDDCRKARVYTGFISPDLSRLTSIWHRIFREFYMV